MRRMLRNRQLARLACWAVLGLVVSGGSVSWAAGQVPQSDVARQWPQSPSVAEPGGIFSREGGWQPSRSLILGVLSGTITTFLLVILYWNHSLRKTVAMRTASLRRELDERQKAQQALKELADELEQRVKERTFALKQEVEERTRSEQAARVSEERFRALFQNISDAVCISDGNGRILAVNQQACLELGYTFEELTALSIPDIEPSCDLAQAQAVFVEVRQKGSLTFEAVNRRRDGSCLPVEINGRFIDFDGKPAMLSVGRNISARRKAEEERQQLLVREQEARKQAEVASQAKDQFIAALSHELRTPLTPVLLTLCEWRREGALEESRREDLEMVVRDVELEIRLIDDLLDITRIAKGKLHMTHQLCDLHQIVQQATRMFREGEGARISPHLAEGLWVHGDPVRLRQVVWNLLSNARKFTPVDGGIVVRAERRDGMAYVSVRDNGVGIAQKDIASLFTAFMQLMPSEGARPQGLGLGLTISRAIAVAHGGELVCVSDGPGKGAEFVLSVPLVELPAEPTPPQPPTAPVSAPQAVAAPGQSVLLVEDHVDTARLFSRLLAKAGYHVKVAHSLAGARQTLADWKPDLLVSDLGLPDGMGYELMAQLRQEGRVPGISVSGYGTPEDISRSREAGFAEHLTKPVTATRLLEVVGRVLAAKS